MIVVSGAPNTNTAATNHLLHHTLRTVDFDYVREMFSKVTVRQQDEAAQQIDHIIGQVLLHKKPVYVEIACNIAGLPITAPIGRAEV